MNKDKTIYLSHGQAHCLSTRKSTVQHMLYCAKCRHIASCTHWHSNTTCSVRLSWTGHPQFLPSPMPLVCCYHAFGLLLPFSMYVTSVNCCTKPGQSLFLSKELKSLDFKLTSLWILFYLVEVTALHFSSDAKYGQFMIIIYISRSM